MSKLKWLYLDVCVLSRPFDDQQQVRVQLETVAFQLILSHIRQGQYKLIFSPVHQEEIMSIPQIQERQSLLGLLTELGHWNSVDLTMTRQRAEMLVNSGLGIADAAHVAFAEQFKADFVTVDDRLLKRCHTLSLSIWCGSPQAYCEKEGLL